MCHECDPVCSVPIRSINGPAEPNLAVCTGGGNWPGPGGCNYCRQTVLRLTSNTNTSESARLECVEVFPHPTPPITSAFFWKYFETKEFIKVYVLSMSVSVPISIAERLCTPNGDLNKAKLPDTRVFGVTTLLDVVIIQTHQYLLRQKTAWLSMCERLYAVQVSCKVFLDYLKDSVDRDLHLHCAKCCYRTVLARNRTLFLQRPIGCGGQIWLLG